MSLSIYEEKEEEEHISGRKGEVTSLIWDILGWCHLWAMGLEIHHRLGNVDLELLSES